MTKNLFRLSKAALVLTVLLYACQQKKAAPVNEQGGVEVIVKHPAGSSWTSGQSPFLASPVNIAELDDIPILIMSDRLKEGQAIQVTLLGAIRLLEKGENTTYLLAVPTKVSEQTISIVDFSDLITSYSSAKWIIEQYLLSRNGMGSASLISWEDQNYVLNKILQSEEKK